MLEFLLKLLAGAATVAAVVGAAIVINGMITKAKLRAELQKRRVQAALVDAIDNCENVVKLEDIYSGNEIEVRGDGVARDIHVGETIYA